MPWLSATADGNALLLQVRAQPGAARTEVAGTYGARLRIRVAAPPVDGKANRALLTFLASRCGLVRNAVTLVGGQRGRDKLFRLEGIGPEQLTTCLLPS